MTEGFEHLADGKLLAVIDATLDALSDDRLRLPGDRDLLDLLAASMRIEARLRAWQAGLAAQIEAREAAWHEHGTSTATWLAEAANLTRREAARLIATGQQLSRFPVVAAATASGQVLAGQAEAITSVLADLPGELPVESVLEAEKLMVGFAASHNSAELRKLSGRLLEVLVPEVAEERESERLEREHRIAMRCRQLTFIPDHRGSVIIRGSLPVAEAEPLIRIVDSYAAAAKRGLEALDPLAEPLTSAMRRADGLLAMVAQLSQQALAPSNGGDRPRVVVTLSYDKLMKAATDSGAVHGTLVGSGEPLSASVLRRWLCDADVLPVVLGGASQVLDVGRSQRLVTPAIRAGLELRDGGCVFPGCDRRPEACHAHHLIPWWAGGVTALWNLVLLCPHHHGIVEPGHDPTADRWQVRLRADQVAEVLPPRRVDAEQRPRIHTRFLGRT